MQTNQRVKSDMVNAVFRRRVPKVIPARILTWFFRPVFLALTRGSPSWRSPTNLSAFEALLSPDVRSSVERVGGFDEIERSLRRVGAWGFPLLASALLLDPIRRREVLVVEGYDELESDLLSGKRLIVMQPHIGTGGAVIVHLLLQQLDVATFTYDPSGEATRVWSSLPQVRLDAVRSIEVPSPWAAVRAAKALREGRILIWQPDVTVAQLGTARYPELNLVGRRVRVSPVACELAARFEAAIYIAYSRIADGRPEIQLVFRRLAVDVHASDLLEELYEHANQAILQNIDQWTLWRYYENL